MAENKPAAPLSATEFKPLDASGARRRFRISPLHIGVGVVLVVAVAVFAYTWLSRRYVRSES